MKILLLFVILIFAMVVAMALITRLLKAQQRLGELQDDLKRNDEEMQRHRRRIDEIAAQQAVDKEK